MFGLISTVVSFPFQVTYKVGEFVYDIVTTPYYAYKWGKDKYFKKNVEEEKENNPEETAHV